MILNVGDICIMKKKHPCGSSRFVVMRTGMDIRFKCEGCGRELWMVRSKAVGGIKSVESKAVEDGNIELG